MALLLYADGLELSVLELNFGSSTCGLMLVTPDRAGCAQFLMPKAVELPSTT
jgi:hypothetical protein